MKKKEKEKEETVLESNVVDDLDIRLHENGHYYRLYEVGGMDEPIKLFNTNKPQRLEGEEYYEYKLRRKLVQISEKTKNWFYTGRTPYVKNK